MQTTKKNKLLYSDLIKDIGYQVIGDTDSIMDDNSESSLLYYVLKNNDGKFALHAMPKMDKDLWGVQYKKALDELKTFFKNSEMWYNKKEVLDALINQLKVLGQKSGLDSKIYMALQELLRRTRGLDLL